MDKFGSFFPVLVLASLEFGFESLLVKWYLISLLKLLLANFDFVSDLFVHLKHLLHLVYLFHALHVFNSLPINVANFAANWLIAFKNLRKVARKSLFAPNIVLIGDSGRQDTS